MKKTRVVILNHGNFFAGGERSLLVLVNSLDRGKYELIVGTGSKNPLLSDLNKSRIRTLTYRMPKQSPFSVPFRPLYLLQFILKVILIRPDIIHANSLTMSKLSGILSLFGFKTVGHVRDIVPLNLLSTWMVGLNGVIVANSRATSEYLIRAGVKKKKIKVIYNGVDLNEFDSSKLNREATRKSMGLNQKDFVIGSIGTIHPRKNQLWLIEALTPLLKDHKKIHLILVGPIDDQEYFISINNLVKNSGLGSQVEILGARSDIAEIINTCDVVVLVSRQEPFGRVLIEAMSLGIPVIGTDVGGVREIITPKTGFLIRSEDSRALVNSLFKIRMNLKMRKLLSENGKKRVSENFTDSLYSQKISLVYNYLKR